MTLEDYVLMSAFIKHIWLSWYAFCVITDQSQSLLHGKLDVSKVIAERTTGMCITPADRIYLSLCLWVFASFNV